MDEGTLRVDDTTVLTPLRSAHVPAYAALVEQNVARLVRWFPWAANEQRDDEIEAYLASLEAQRARGERNESYAILVEGELAGSLSIHDHEPRNDVAELGYWLGERFGHRGIVTRCVGALCTHAFATGMHRLEIMSAAANLPSRALAERSGFVFEGVLRERVRTSLGYEDAALYARLANDVLR